ncbi:MAG: acetyl-CoA synthetase (NDP-forming) beta subunit [Deltaproteobacteria bacterium]|nr:acetyl-CoA synthetase (NDP-forming) beta subunit [Deltaproteobacteria bacterium]
MVESLLLGVEALTFLEEEGFPVLKSLLARNEDDAANKAVEIGFPVTLKISSPDVIHKTETGGIRVLLKDETEVRQAFKELVGNFTSSYPEKKLDGVIIQKQGNGLEVIVGMLKDPQFGPVLMFGLGGVFVEVMKDVAFRLIPIEASDSGPIDLMAAENFLFQLSAFIAKHPEVREMDVNPLFISSPGTGVQICDARIKRYKKTG